jgi:type III secretion protein C
MHFFTVLLALILSVSFSSTGTGGGIDVLPLVTYPKPGHPNGVSKAESSHTQADPKIKASITESQHTEPTGQGLSQEKIKFTAHPAVQPDKNIFWKTPLYSRHSNQEDLGELMRDFGSQQGMNVVLSQLATGTISGYFDRVPAREFLDFISKAQNLIWYYDGKTLYLYRSDEIVSQFASVDFIPLSSVEPILEHLGIYDPRYDLKAAEESGIILVTGPPRYVELVLNTIRMLDSRAAVQNAAAQSQVVIRVFPLRYAWADDVQFDILNKSVTLPGVASILRDILTGHGMYSSSLGRKTRQLPATLSKLKGTGLAGQGKEPEPVEEDKPETERSTRDIVLESQSFVVPDNRLNAVIVRDRQERMSFYEQTIALLDIPESLVQIQATIIDINTDYLRELGVDWRFQTNRTLKIGKDHPARTGFGFNSTDGTSLDTQQLGTGPSFNFSTIIGNTAEYFIGQVHALEQSGNAKIISRPSVLTLNNLEAVLEHTQTFYIRVAGQEEVDLFNVSAGTVLRVTPHIIHENGKTLIKLGVSIEDGDVSDVKVDEIPIVQKSTIRTQAVILENESLLIGGMSRDSRTYARQGIPCLGSIPGLGMLFREDQKGNSKMERLFLITPTVVTHDRYPTVSTPTDTGVTAGQAASP